MFLLCNIEKLVLVKSMCRAFPFQFKYHHTSIVTRCEKINLWVGGYDPESVQVAFERLYRSALIEVPNTDGLIFTDREDEVLVGMEYTCRSVLEMSAACVDFPCLGI